MAPTAQNQLLEVYWFVKRAFGFVEGQEARTERLVIEFESRLFTMLRWQLISYLRKVHQVIPTKQKDAMKYLKQIDKLRRDFLKAPALREIAGEDPLGII